MRLVQNMYQAQEMPLFLKAWPECMSLTIEEVERELTGQVLSIVVIIVVISIRHVVFWNTPLWQLNCTSALNIIFFLFHYAPIRQEHNIYTQGSPVHFLLTVYIDLITFYWSFIDQTARVFSERILLSALPPFLYYFFS